MPGGASAASCAAWPGVTWRGLGAKTKPIASTLASAAAAIASALVIPQIFIHMGPSVAILPVRCPRSVQDFRDHGGRIIAVHQGGTDQRQAVPEAAHGMGVGRRRHTAFRYTGGVL